MRLSTDRSRNRNLVDARLVLDNCRSTKSELQWALRTALDLADQAEARMREGEPIISAIEDISTRIADRLVEERTGA